MVTFDLFQGICYKQAHFYILDYFFGRKNHDIKLICNLLDIQLQSNLYCLKQIRYAQTKNTCKLIWYKHFLKLVI